MSYGDFKKNTLYMAVFDECIASRRSADVAKFMIARQVTARKQSCTQCRGNPADNSKRI
jgi:hypothetical protein